MPTDAAIERLRRLLEIWGRRVSSDEGVSAGELAETISEQAGRDWEFLAVLDGVMPTVSRIEEFRDRCFLDGLEARIRSELAAPPSTPFGEPRIVHLVVDPLIIDVHHTSGTDRITGVQRVVRETVRRWVDDHGALPVAWSDDHRSLRTLRRVETVRIHGDRTVAEPIDPEVSLIPIGGRFVMLEVAAEKWRADLVRSIATCSPITMLALGHDCVPVLLADASIDPMVQGFPDYLEALAGAERVATVSESARREFQAWMQMAGGVGLVGPELHTVHLAASRPEPTATAVASTVKRLGLIDDEPLVLVVGSHEPRKNHLAVLAAARRLWSEGVRFRLAFIGGHAWGEHGFRDAVTSMTADGHPIVVISGADDEMLGAAYRLASFTVFPSFAEGFGLPVVESLMAGTPVITSNYGSMAEIAGMYGGTLTVDPRNDLAVTEAMRALLSDPAQLAALRESAESTSFRSWDDYSAELFRVLIG